ncbi:hypothetical protein BSKO_05097 [Bryopsis sp. KO-2023]|nr:hypothetical protein BSKO_05097 [Bryopsis sp. KO-2023]
MGNSYADWGKVLACLVVMYLALGFLYSGLTSVAVELRQEEWLELPSTHFGDFEKTERFVLDDNFSGPARYTPASTDVLANGMDMRTRLFNRPTGCKAVTADNVLVCDATHDLFSLYPWIIDQGVAAGMAGCQYVADKSLTTTVLNEDGTYAGNSVCLNAVTKASIP